MISSKSQRGSILIVAMIFAGVIAVVLTSYLKLASNASKLADRSFYANGAQNLVDIGLEQALWSINNSTWTGSAGFTLYVGTEYQATFPSSTTYFNLSEGVKGQVKVWVNPSISPPHAVAKAILTLGDGTTLTKFAEVYMQKASIFANGLVAKDTINFVGNVQIDSWNGHSDTASTADDVAYSAGVAHDSATIASLRTTTASISVGQADVYGFAAVGGNSITDISVGPNGRVGAYGTPPNTIDPARVTYDFTTNFPDAINPTAAGTTIGAIGGSITLPVNTADAHSVNTTDGKTYYYYSVPSIDIASHDTVSITAGYNVVITVTSTSGTVVKSVGNAAFAIAPAASLQLYTAGNVSIGGNGVINGVDLGAPNPTTSFQLFGTRSAATAASVGMQSIDIKGNGYLSGIVYAPNGNVGVDGGGSSGAVLGAVVANQVSMNGNGNFHYDESLANFSSSNVWKVSKWRELTSDSDRNLYATKLAF